MENTVYKLIDNSEYGLPSVIKKADAEYFIPLDTQNYDFRKVAADIIKYGTEIFEGEIPKILEDFIDQTSVAESTEAYKNAKERLSRYRLAGGREQHIIKTKRISGVDKDGIYTFEDIEVTISAIDPLPVMIEVTEEDDNHIVTKKMIDNPVVVKDEEERAAAQAIVDSTPQRIIDLINGQG